MKGIEINFMNRPNSDGTITKSIVISDSLIVQSGSPTIRKPQVTVHLPKVSQEFSPRRLTGFPIYLLEIPNKQRTKS